ncbi:MAG: D-sedoheptulose 7-phosphate isomerase [Cyclobacteriaceae bacterium]|nr:D-sedoheptulose 7-phosphate isomerase [Cyclobacteriaceae bacterium]
MAEDQIIVDQFTSAITVAEAFIGNKSNIQKIREAAHTISHALQHGGKVLSCGNGGSMCDAMHFAEELTGRFRNDRSPLAAIAIADPSHLSCVANDFGYDQVFSRYVDALGQSNDVLLAISSSGNSTNVILAAEKARGKKMKVIGLTGKDGGILGPLCDVEIRVPHDGYADRIQEIHIKVIHTLILLIELHVKGDG